MHKQSITPRLSPLTLLALLAMPACDQEPSEGPPQVEHVYEESSSGVPDDASEDEPSEDPDESDLPAERPVPEKDTAAHSVPDDLVGAQLVIKFIEGSDVEQQDGFLVSPAPTAADIDEVETDLTMAMDACESAGLSLQPLFGLSPEVMTEITTEGESNTGQGLADLSLYFNAELLGATKETLVDLLTTLNGLDSVEIAYIQPRPQVSTIVSPPDANTPNFTSSQGYVADDSNGIHRSVAWSRTGGRGDYVRIIDVEGAWVEDHEDLPAPFHFSGTESTDLGWINHGTAVSGVLVGREDGLGVTGIVPSATIGYSAIFGPGGTAAAILSAAQQLDAGDILLVEVQYGGGPQTAACTCNRDQCNYLPVEYYPAEFDAIQTATAKGIIVVEAGGNGTVNLDDPRYEGRFDRRVRDSGAILVGASSSSARQPACFTNYGSRIDIHAWGENVVTLGYGDAYQGRLGERDKYTRSFGGTSSASPIVVGALASLQSISYARGSGRMTARELLHLLQTTGTAQDSSTASRWIGPMPNLEAALASLGW